MVPLPTVAFLCVQRISVLSKDGNSSQITEVLIPPYEVNLMLSLWPELWGKWVYMYVWSKNLTSYVCARIYVCWCFHISSRRSWDFFFSLSDLIFQNILWITKSEECQNLVHLWNLPWYNGIPKPHIFKITYILHSTEIRGELTPKYSWEAMAMRMVPWLLGIFYI